MPLLPDFFQRRENQAGSISFLMGFYCGVLHLNRKISLFNTWCISEVTHILTQLIIERSISRNAFLLGFFLGSMMVFCKSEFYDEHPSNNFLPHFKL